MVVQFHLHVMYMKLYITSIVPNPVLAGMKGSRNLSHSCDTVRPKNQVVDTFCVAV